MLQRYGGGNMDEGWTRLMFEQFNVPYTSLMDAEIKKGGLEAKYDVIVLPADSVAAMTGERAPAAAGGGRGGGGGGGGARKRHRPSSRAGSAPTASRRSRHSCRRAGRSSPSAQAGDLPIQRFGLPVRNVVAGLPGKEFWSPGSTLRVRFNNTNPLVYGMPAEGSRCSSPAARSTK